MSHLMGVIQKDIKRLAMIRYSTRAPNSDEQEARTHILLYKWPEISASLYRISETLVLHYFMEDGLTAPPLDRPPALEKSDHNTSNFT